MGLTCSTGVHEKCVLLVTQYTSRKGTDREVQTKVGVLHLKVYGRECSVFCAQDHMLRW
jgi:hypothetical protein